MNNSAILDRNSIVGNYRRRRHCAGELTQVDAPSKQRYKRSVELCNICPWYWINVVGLARKCKLRWLCAMCMKYLRNIISFSRIDIKLWGKANGNVSEIDLSTTEFLCYAEEKEYSEKNLFSLWIHSVSLAYAKLLENKTLKAYNLSRMFWKCSYLDSHLIS